MKLIKPSVEILDRIDWNINSNLYKEIERAGRICYKSEDRITDSWTDKFIQTLINKGHTAMLEHGTVYLKTDENNDLADKYVINRYSLVRWEHECGSRITTNYRVLYENNWLDDLQYLCEPTKYHEKRVSVRFICDRGISHKRFVA